MIRKDTDSASTIAGRTVRSSWEYLDGLGRSYRSATTGATSDTNAQTSVLRGFDDRGNLAWASIPLLATEVTANPTAAGFRTSFTYDALDRPISQTDSIGARTDTQYVSANFAPLGATILRYHAGVQSLDAHCFDTVTDATTCGETRQFKDAFGGVVRDVCDESVGTDVGLTAGDRITSYRNDGLGRLIGITDPVGATWSYTYDCWGDRVQANDPGFGLWTMT